MNDPVKDMQHRLFLFIGHPGQGKSSRAMQLAQKLAAEFNTNVCRYDNTLMGHFVGQAETNIREAFDENQKNIIIIDGLDEFKDLTALEAILCEKIFDDKSDAYKIIMTCDKNFYHGNHFPAGLHVRTAAYFNVTDLDVEMKIRLARATRVTLGKDVSTKRIKFKTAP